MKISFCSELLLLSIWVNIEVMQSRSRGSKSTISASLIAAKEPIERASNGCHTETKIIILLGLFLELLSQALIRALAS